MSNTITIYVQYTDPANQVIAGSKQAIKVPIDSNILDVFREHNIDIEGACGGVCACATCHVWIADPYFNKLPIAKEQEESMLDQASDITPTSRLCCQLTVTSDMEGMVLTVPYSSKNIGGHHH